MQDTLSDPDAAALAAISLRFISSASVAGNIIQLAVDSHRRYWAAIREAEKHLAGAKPRDPEALREANLAWSANYNYNKAKAKADQGTAENYGEVMRALAMASIEFRYPKDDDKDEPILAFLEDPIAMEYFGSHLMTAFMDMLEGDARFSGFLVNLEANAYLYGYGTAISDGNRDYLGVSMHPLSVAFKPESRVDDMPLWIVFDKFDGDMLWGIWKSIKSGKKIRRDADNNIVQFKNYWHLDALQNVLLKAYGGKIARGHGATLETQPAVWDDVLSAFTNSSSATIADTKTVRIAKIWNREIDGSYTETYVTYERSPESCDEPLQESGELLYQRNYEKVKATDKINLIRDSAISPNGYIQDLRGIAKYAIEDSKRFNRQKNSLDDKLQFAGSPMIMQPSARQGTAFKIGVQSGFSLMPYGYSFPVNQPRFDLQPHVEYMRITEDDYRRETSLYDPKVTGRLSSRPNKDEIAKVSSDAGMGIGAKLNIKFADYSQLMLRMLRSLPALKPKAVNVKEHVEGFYDAVAWALRDFLTGKDAKERKGEINTIIGAVRSFSIERVSGDIDSLRMSLAMAETPFEINRLERMILLAIGHPRKEVNRLKPAIFEARTTYEDERMAAVENHMFNDTAEVVYRSTDDPIIHLDMHMSKLNRVLEEVKEQTKDPVEAFTWAKRAMQHMIRHIEKIQKTPFLQRHEKKYIENYKFFLNQLEQLKQFAEQRAKQIREQQAQQQAGQGGIDPVELKKLQLLELKHRTAEQRKAELYQTKTQRETDRFNSTEQRKQTDHQARLRREEENASIKQRLKVIEAAAKVNNE